jgi:hypothetical protein
VERKNSRHKAGADSNFLKLVESFKTDRKLPEKFLDENPEFEGNHSLAKEILNYLDIIENEVTDKEISGIWKTIELHYRQQHLTKERIFMRKFLKVAAIFILVATAFTVTYYVTNTREQPDFPDEGFSAAGIKEARLILSGGEEIILKEKHSAIEFDSVSSQIHIQRDSSFSYSSSTEKNAMTQVVVPFGKRSDIVLSDGTRVCLNAGSVLLFPQKFQGKERLVFLKGEAYFKVEKNHGKPFIVSADKLYVTVLGTEFNLKANESDVDMEIVLVKGAVSLRENKMLSFLDREISLKPNQRAIYHKSENKTTIESGVNTGYFTSWTEGFLEFNTESILNVFNRLSMYYNVRFVTDSSVELNRKISGKLDLKESLEEVLKVVADAAPVSFRVSEDQIYVSSRVDYIPKY